jgi:hypothetical protein
MSVNSALVSTFARAGAIVATVAHSACASGVYVVGDVMTNGSQAVDLTASLRPVSAPVGLRLRPRPP